jgi:hypothetical protein
VNGFIDHLHTPLGTPSNYSAIADLHTLHITTTRYAFSSLLYLNQPFPGNGGDFSTSRTQVLSSPTLVQDCLPAIPQLNWIDIPSQVPSQSSAALSTTETSALFFYKHFARTE